jgi:hypothetical protein
MTKKKLDQELDEIVSKYSNVSDEKKAQEGLREALGLLAKYKSSLENLTSEKDDLKKKVGCFNKIEEQLCDLTIQVKSGGSLCQSAEVCIKDDEETYLITDNEGLCNVLLAPGTYSINLKHSRIRENREGKVTIIPGQKKLKVYCTR